jgi:glycerophosphoryl diester phosphodiesterase
MSIIVVLTMLNAFSFQEKMLVAHRGASGYAPEHTAAAYELAIKQGADYVEQDLQVTRDGVLVCLHDSTLERTTNVEQVFPDRWTEVEVDGRKRRVWYVRDFTLQEIKSLDAGSWFSPKFKGAQVLTFREAIRCVGGRAGLYPETKEPDTYGELGIPMERLVVDDLLAEGLDPRAPSTRVIIQSFSRESLRRLRVDYGVRLPLVYLVSAGNAEKLDSLDKLQEIAGTFQGIGPAKELLVENPRIVEWAHRAGLTVTPYTFRARSPGEGFKDVTDEMRYFLYQLGVDALFTDNPDLFPRKP